MSAGRSPQLICLQLYPRLYGLGVQKFGKQLKLGHGYSAHSMRATFITTVLENGAKLEDVQLTVGHAHPSTTQLYKRQRFTPTMSAALMVDYGIMSEGGL